jgi:PAS domain S-box-containing protein
MGDEHGKAGKVLDRLMADVVRLCHAREAKLGCGTTEVACFNGRPGPRVPIATQPFGVGTDAFELTAYDDHARELTPQEAGAFQALTEAVNRELERLHSSAVRSDEDWILAHLSVTVDYVSDAFILLRADWTVLHVNTQFERMVCRTRTDVVGRNFWEIFPDAIGTSFERELRAAMEGSVLRVFEEFSPRLGRWFHSRGYPCKEGLAVLTIDITDRKADELARADIEQKLLQVQRMESLGTLASGIAHDFNNILGAILGHVGLLREHIAADAPARESVEQIGIAGARARDLVQRILSVSRRSQREFVRQPLRPLVEETLALMQSTLPASTELVRTLSVEPMSCTLNPADVHQVVMNLCTNAWQALPLGHGRITVRLRGVRLDEPRPANVGVLLPGRYAELSVGDTGTGMAADVLARLFEPFFTTKPRGQGTGLGLHVVRNIVTAHGGAVVVSSTPGRGSMFRVYLPASRSIDSEPAPAPQDMSKPGRGERVAYVDDDEVVLLMVERLLARAGFDVTAYSKPEALLEALAHDTACFDLLVTDYSMPGMSGTELARQAHRQCPDLPVIVSSGFVSEEIRSEAEAAGVSHVINKERTYEELAALASRALKAGSVPAGDNAGSEAVNESGVPEPPAKTRPI